MAASWSADADTYSFDAFIGVETTIALPVVGAEASSATALDLAAGQSGLPHGLAIAADYSCITGTPDGGTSTGSSAPYDKTGPGVYTATITNGVTTQVFTVNLHSAGLQDAGGYDTEQADAALSLSADLNDREWPAIPS